MSKKNLSEIRKMIINKLKDAGIMPFIIEEVSYSLNYLNYYKLTNIKDNIDLFIDKITNLNQQYYKSLME